MIATVIETDTLNGAEAPCVITSAGVDLGQQSQQKDLATSPGSESAVSEILSGKRERNKQQSKRLSRRFDVSPAVFF